MNYKEFISLLLRCFKHDHEGFVYPNNFVAYTTFRSISLSGLFVDCLTPLAEAIVGGYVGEVRLLYSQSGREWYELCYCIADPLYPETGELRLYRKMETDRTVILVRDYDCRDIHAAIVKFFTLTKVLLNQLK